MGAGCIVNDFVLNERIPTSFEDSMPEDSIEEYLGVKPPLVRCRVRELEYMSGVFMLDSGSDINIVRLTSLSLDAIARIDRESQIQINGANYGLPLCTLGVVTMFVEDVPTVFHVVREMPNFQEDGILGSLFFHMNEAKIDYTTDTISFGDTVLKFEERWFIALPPRTRTQVEAPMVPTDNTESFIPLLNLQPGVFAGNCAVTVKNNKCQMFFVNTLEETKYLILPKLRGIPFETLEDYKSDSNISTRLISPAMETDERKQQVLDSIDMSHLNSEELRLARELIWENSDVFYLPGEPLKCTNAIKHKIRLTTDEPIAAKQYRHPYHHTQEINRIIQELLDQNIIERSDSPYCSPLLLIPKKELVPGVPRWRVVIDFRRLNDVTRGDKYPLPLISDQLDRLGDAKYFSVFDLKAGYHQVPMDPADVEKTAFNANFGHYAWLRVPEGLKNAPATFQRMMDQIMSGLQGIELLVFMDDAIVFAKDLKEHNTRCSRFFSRLRDANLTLEPGKAQLLCKEAVYLGHCITPEGVKPDERLINSIQHYPIPKDVTAIKSFLGLCSYYRKFVKDFSKIAQPLRLLERKGQPFIWGIEQQIAFQTLKNILITKPLLQFPKFDAEFLLACDASFGAIGAVLSQGELGSDLPVAYFSHTLNKTQKKWPVIEKECYAIFEAVHHFRPYLLGRPFTIISDHRPLTWLNSIEDPSSKLTRWRLRLAEFDYKIIYRPGSLNKVADALSRYPPEPQVEAYPLGKKRERDEDMVSSNSPPDKVIVFPALEKQTNKFKKQTTYDASSSDSTSSHIFTAKRFRKKKKTKKNPKKVTEIESPKHETKLTSPKNLIEDGNESPVHLQLPETEEEASFSNQEFEVARMSEIECSLSEKGNSENEEEENSEEQIQKTDEDENEKLSGIESNLADEPMQIDEEKSSSTESANDMSIEQEDESSDKSEETLIYSPQVRKADKIIPLLVYDTHGNSAEENMIIGTESPSDDIANDLCPNHYEFDLKEYEKLLKKGKKGKQKTTKIKESPAKICEITEHLLTQKGPYVCMINTKSKPISEIGVQLERKKFLNEIEGLESTIGTVYAARYGKNLIFAIIGKGEENMTIKQLEKAIRTLRYAMTEEDVKSVYISKRDMCETKIAWYKIKQMFQKIFEGSDFTITICLETIITPPPKDRYTIIEEHHSSIACGHKGVDKTYKRIKTYYYWESMKQEITEFIKHCEACQRKKYNRERRKNPMVITDTPKTTFEKVSLDVVGPLTETPDGYQFICTMQCQLSKWVICSPMKTADSISIANAFAHDCIARFGCPAQILSDQGPPFMSTLMKQVTKLFKIKKFRTSSYRAQSNGALERSHACLVEFLRFYVNEKKENWKEYLDFYTFSYNSSVHEATGFSPFEIVYGRVPRIPSSFELNENDEITYTDYVKTLSQTLGSLQRLAHENLIAAKEKSKRNYDRTSKENEFSVGDFVYIRKQERAKLDDIWVGPYEVLEVLKSNNLKIRIKRSHKIIHKDYCKIARISDPATKTRVKNKRK